ncbi:MAG: 5'-nucleotidase C-terminal domain-containing protein [Anaerolineae bacterium]
MRDIGMNETGLSWADLKALRERPDLWAKNLTHGMNNDVYLLKDGLHVVRLAKDRREDNPFHARPLEVGTAMQRLRGQPTIEQIVYACEDEQDGEAVIISLYRDRLTQLSKLPTDQQRSALNDRGLTALIDTCAFLDEQGVQHKDLCDWNVQFDTETLEPFFLDFDSMRVIDWTQGNLPLEPIALGFERDSSTLRTEVLNIDDLQENFLFEAFFFTYHDEEAFAVPIFRRFLELQHDLYCPRLINYFQSIKQPDFADMIALRAKKIGEWLASPVKLYKLYLRKRMHFLMRGYNWATEVSESGEYDVKWFMTQVQNDLMLEVQRRERLENNPNALLYIDPDLTLTPTTLRVAPSPHAERGEGQDTSMRSSPLSVDGEGKASQSDGGGEGKMPTITITLHQFPRITVDLSAPNTFSPDIPKPANAIRIIAFGDVHQKVGRIERMTRIAHAVRTHYPVETILSLGDNVEGGTDIEAARFTLECLDVLQISASALGNHEFDYHDLDALAAGKATLAARLRAAIIAEDPNEIQLAQEYFQFIDTTDVWGPFLHWMRIQANFRFLCANVTDSLSSFTPGAITEWGGKPILLLSALTPAIEHELSYHKRRGFPTPVELRPEHPRDLLLEQVRRIKAKYPNVPFTVVVMSHCGINFDRNELVHPEFDLILGSHTHNLAHLTADWGDGHVTHMVYGGQNAYYLPLVDFAIRDDGRIDRLWYTLIDVDASQLPSNTLVEPLHQQILGTAAELLSLEGKSTRSTALLRLVTDAMRQQSGAELAINYGGNVREGLSRGSISEDNLAEMMPFPDEARIVTLTAAQIQAVIEYGVWSSRNDVGKKCLMFHPSGFSWAVDAAGQVTVNLPPADGYRVCVPRYLLEGFGDAFPLTLPARNGDLTITSTGKSIRDLLAAEIRARGTVSDDGDTTRITIDPAAPLLYNDPTIAY